jgi:hypothetical protein
MTTKNQNTKVINFRCADDLHIQLKKLSDKTMIPLSIMCRQALIEYVKNQAVNVMLTEPSESKSVIQSVQAFKNAGQKTLSKPLNSPKSLKSPKDMHEPDWSQMPKDNEEWSSEW